jgi:hypothetical protein
MIEMLEEKLKYCTEQIVATAMKQDKLYHIDPEELDSSDMLKEEMNAWDVFFKVEMKALILLKYNTEGMIKFLKTTEENRREETK